MTRTGDRSSLFLERIENGPFFVNTYLLGCRRSGEAVLIDPGHEQDRISRRMTESRLRYTAIVNTHGHIDHVASARHFQDAMELPFCMHADDRVFLDALADTCAMYGLPPLEPPRLDTELRAGDTYTVGEVSFTLRHAPGHSPGSLIFDLGETMIVGDVVFQGSIGRTDLPMGDTDTLLESIRREVLTKPDAVTLWPGHGPETTVGTERAHNPFLLD